MAAVINILDAVTYYDLHRLRANAQFFFYRNIMQSITKYQSIIYMNQ